MSGALDLRHYLLTVLKADAGVVALVGPRVYDRPPPDVTFPYLSIGSADWSPENLACLDARRVTYQVDAYVRDLGRLWPVEALTDAVAAALHDRAGSARDSAVASLEVEMVRTFRDPDGETARGVVMVTALLEAG